MLTTQRTHIKTAAALRADAGFASHDRAPIQLRMGASGVEIMIYGEIGFYGITAGQVVEALAQAAGDPVTIRINSPGGDVFDGLAMHAALKTYKGEVRAQIDGLAASAASVVMLGASSVDMVRGSFVMVHNAWGVSIGNAAEMRDFANLLDQMDANLADLYAAKSGKTDAAAWRQAMAAETWMNADDAIAVNIVDRVIDAPAVAAHVKPGLFRNAPKALIAPEDRREHMRQRLELLRRSA